MADNGDAAGVAVPRARSILPWVFACILWLPATAPYLAHFLGHADGLTPTGFIQYDQAYYFACAREYFDRGELSLFYPLPFSANPYNEAVYFQPHIALMGLLWRLTGFAPGTIYCLLGAIFGIVCMRAMLAIYERRVGLDGWAKRLGALGVAWGGGFLWLSGVLFGLFQGEGLEVALSKAFRFDPFEGWWFLNLGRNLIFATEAYYHALALGFGAFVDQRRFGWALASLGLLSLSHPFTGTEWLLIAGLWAFAERFYLRSDAVPRYMPWALVGLSAVHAAYYGIFIHRDEEHAALVKQWALNWGYDASGFIPAYALVALLVLYRFRRPRKLLSALRSPFARLCVVWAVTAFALANHEFAIKPVQPLHFTRGYVWLPLMWLGVPVLVSWLESLDKRLVVLGGVVAALLLVDNTAWMVRRTRLDPRSAGGLLLSERDQTTLSKIAEAAGAPVLLAAPDLAYLATVFTPRRAFLSHGFNTPNAASKRREWSEFLATCRLPRELAGEDLLLVIDPAPRRPLLLGVERVAPDAAARCDFVRTFGEPWFAADGVRMWRIHSR